MKKVETRPLRMIALGSAKRETRASFIGTQQENPLMQYNP